jgi:hypothetical protein
VKEGITNVSVPIGTKINIIDTLTLILVVKERVLKYG